MMNLRFVFFFSLCLLFFEKVESTDLFQGKKITQIVTVGNNKTKDYVIIREMKTKIGDTYDSLLVEEDRKRIQNLLLFTRVEVQAMPVQESGIILVIMVAERWFFFPYPLLYRNERSWDKWSYGAGVLHNNIAGKNNKLLAELWLGYNPGGQFSYTNPWFGGDKQFYYKASAFYLKIKSQSLDFPRFDELHRGLSFSLGKRWGYHTYSALAIGYDLIEFPSTYSQLLPSKKLHQSVPTIGFAFTFDRRDLYEYPRDGGYFDVYILQTYYPDQLNYLQYGCDLRKYKRIIKDFSLALRFAVDLSDKNVPVFARKFVGYKERIRGEFFTQKEGDNRFIAASEFRIPLLPVRYIHLDSGSPILGDYSRNLPFGISLGLFYEIGTAWYNHGHIQRSQLLQGFGCGFHFHVPYADVFRLEYAFNTEWESQIIFDIGVAF